MNREEMLEKARNDYPDGCVFRSAASGDQRTFNGAFKIEENGSIHVKTQESNGIKYVYDSTKNKWAEIISTPQPQEDVTKMEKKPQFEVGKWYKGIGNDNFIAKYIKTDGFDFISDGFFIHKNKYQSSTCNGRIGKYKNAVECPLSEIQQYLPDGHPDKLVAAQEDNWVFTSKGSFGYGMVEADEGKVFKVIESDDLKYTLDGKSNPFTITTGAIRVRIQDVRKALPHEIPGNKEPVVPTYVEQANAYMQVSQSSKYEDFGRTMESDIAEFYEKPEPAKDENLHVVITPDVDLYIKKKTILF